MTEDRLSARERELLDDMRRDIDRLKRAEPSDLFTRGDPRLIYENKGLLQENSKLRQDLEELEKESNRSQQMIMGLELRYNAGQESRDRLRARIAELEKERDDALQKVANLEKDRSVQADINVGAIDNLMGRLKTMTEQRDEALRKVDEAEVHGRKAADWAWKRTLEDAKAETQKRLDVQQSIINSQNKELQAKDKAIAEDIEEIERLRGDVNVSREAYRHIVASHNELSDLTIKEFGSSVAEEGSIEAAIRLLQEQKKRIAELEQELAHRPTKQKNAADSAVNAAADIASTLAAGIREWNEKKRKWEG